MDKECFEYFFDSSKRKKPFAGGLEETVAYLSWLDLFVEFLRRQKKCELEEKMFDEKEAKETIGAAADYIRERIVASAQFRSRPDYGISISEAAARFGLFGYGFFCLLLAIAPSFDLKYCKYYKYLRDDEAMHGYATFDLAERLYSLYADDEEALAMRASGSLFGNCVLFKVQEDDDFPGDLSGTLDASRQLIALLKGDYSLSGEFSEYAWEDYRVYDPAQSLFGKEQAEQMRAYLRMTTGVGEEKLILLHGMKGSGRHYYARMISSAEGSLFINGERLLEAEDTGMKKLMELLVRAEVLGQELVIDCGDKKAEELIGLYKVCFQSVNRLIVLATERGNVRRLSLEFSVFDEPMPVPDYQETYMLWEHYAKDLLINADLREYAGKYNLPAGIIRRVVEKAQTMADARDSLVITTKDLNESIMSYNRNGIEQLGTKLKTNFSWDDLILGFEQKKVLRLICDRIKLRNFVNDEWGFGEKITYGRGLSVLLYGAPGTGKTMTAQILAKEIGMELYRIDLSRIVDKYIGETQKNIGRIFDAAKNANCILFFDEAEALFSKRTEVSSSNDKHANNETAYLLQKMEEFDGICILATNRYADFDQAFVRRITYTIHYDKPDAMMRRKLFESVIPKKAKIDCNLNFSYFAEKYDDLSGSNIKSIVYNAAFMAASEKNAIGNEHIARAVIMEYKKQGRMIDENEILIMSS